MHLLHYSFNNNPQNTSSSILVSTSDLYSTNKGYGFVIEKNRREQEVLQIPELNSGFEPWYWLNSNDISILKQSNEGIYIDKCNDFKIEDWPIPLHFKIQIANSGNYTLSIHLKNISELTAPLWIFTGRRRLMYYVHHFSAGSETTQTFTINVSDIIPRGKTTTYNDNTIDLVILSHANIALCDLSLSYTKALPTLYIMGDSTVTDQSTSYPYHPSCSYCGWGQMLSLFLKSGICLSNHAHSGLTSETFRSEGHYDILYNHIKSGDFILIQFGHNDQKLAHLAAYQGYTNELTTYIYELRLKGAFPILITPISRNTWRGDGTYNDLLTDYANACIQIGIKEQIPVIDLHQFSKRFILQHGLETSKLYFFPNDYTHTNDYGGLKMAYYIATSLKNISYLQSFICEYIEQQITPLLESIQVVKPPSPPVNYVDPNINNCIIHFTDIDHCLNKQNILMLSSKGIISNRESYFRPNDFITRVEALEWVTKAVGFVPMNVYNDYYTDVVGHEWYAGIVEVAHQNGIVDVALTSNNLFHPHKVVILEEFISFLINSYKCRKSTPTPIHSISFKAQDVSPYSLSAIQSALEIGLLISPFNTKQKLTRDQAIDYIQKLIVLLQQ